MTSQTKKTYMKHKDKEYVKLAVSDEAFGKLMMVPQGWKKGSLRKTRRLARIRRNVFREIDALNKELKRHRTDIKAETRSGWTIL